MIGDIPASDFPDLRHRSSEEVRQRLSRVFSELPSDGFLPEFKNPCWMGDATEIARAGVHNNELPNPSDPMADLSSLASPTIVEKDPVLTCLPYVYMLGQPKCGTTDLFIRMIRHPHICDNFRKEVCQQNID